MPPFRLPFFGPYDSDQKLQSATGDRLSSRSPSAESASKSQPESAGMDKPNLPGPPVLPKLVAGLEPVNLKLNIIYDSSANDRQGISAEQKKKFENQILPHALKEYADSNVALEPHYVAGSVETNGLLGLTPNAVNVFVSDRTPNRKPGVSSRARNGAFFTILDINKVEAGSLGHELSHHVLGDTYGLADRFVRFLSSIDPALGAMPGVAINTAFDIRNEPVARRKPPVQQGNRWVDADFGFQ